nr:MAG TPA: hypothetical protein [Caudoviricetes sp.]
MPSSRVELLPPVGSSPERAERLSLTDIDAVLVHGNYLDEHCLSGELSRLGNFLAVLFALDCLGLRLCLFVDAVCMAVVLAECVVLVCVFNALYDIFLGIVVAFTGKHSLAADFVVSNAAFSCVELFVVQNCEDKTVISVGLHFTVILFVILIVSLSVAKLLTFSDT